MTIEKLIWIDLEMTGLDPDNDLILEIATVITDKNLQLVAEGPQLVIHQHDEILNQMDEWNTTHHGESGLIDAVRESTINATQAEKQTLDFLKQHIDPQHSPMCGNTICQDRRFLSRYMPKLEQYFHYRNLDVTSLKIATQLWKPDLIVSKDKVAAHRALADVYESIEELRLYRQRLFC